MAEDLGFVRLYVSVPLRGKGRKKQVMAVAGDTPVIVSAPLRGKGIKKLDRFPFCNSIYCGAEYACGLVLRNINASDRTTRKLYHWFRGGNALY
ncbi:hypothetical protein [Baaleninema simplex]|uniref:hypothetical protein n=1 Tax=Baaleninema simplex TaxID=2862350 RepID=UPI001181BB21|nr:hypothetical protein [Baaleninema simplex]